MSTPRTVSLPIVRIMSALAGVLALLGAQLALPAPASAHARLEATSPADGASLTAAPPEVMLRFNEDVNGDLSDVSVTSGSTDVTQGSPEVDGDSLYQPLDSSMAEGEYEVTYKVVSADGHPVSGTFTFTYAPPAASEREGQPAETPTNTASGADGEDANGSSGSGHTQEQGTSEGAEESPSGSESPGGSESPSGSESPGGSESPEPSGTSSSSDTDAAAPVSDGGDGSSGVPEWVWGAGAAGVVLVLAAVALLARGRRTASEEEDITLEDWRD